jgi:ribulose-5-phosphate 4-epimerase/fuculose-1-phosphate aldolase
MHARSPRTALGLVAGLPAWLPAWLIVCAVSLCRPGLAQAPAPDHLLEDLVAANRILADQGVLDGFGHVSARHPDHPGRLLLSRSLAPALTTADDIMEYDFDCTPLNAQPRPSFLERFIHCEIYRARPDVMAVIHTHSQGVIPFANSSVPLRAMFHVAGFLAAGVPVFEIRAHAGLSNLLIADASLGKALAATLGDKAVVLMRGHGDVVVGPSLPIAVYRAIYTDVNARLQAQALALGGSVTYLEKEEGEKADLVQQQVVTRPWELWKRKVMRP